MKVLPCEAEVLLSGSQLRGRILAICIRGSRVSYEVAWFNGDVRNIAWLEECEIELADPKVRRLGLTP